MTEHDKLVNAALNQDVKNAATLFVEELVSSTVAAVRQDPRAYGFVTLKEHDARVTELLDANNREVEARRSAAARIERLQALLHPDPDAPRPSSQVAKRNENDGSAA